LQETGLQMGHAVSQGRDVTMLGLHGVRCTVHRAHTRVITFTVVRNVRPILRRFLCNTQVSSGTVCLFIVPNFIQNGQQMWKVAGRCQRPATTRL